MSLGNRNFTRRIHDFTTAIRSDQAMSPVKQNREQPTLRLVNIPIIQSAKASMKFKWFHLRPKYDIAMPLPYL